MSKLKNFFRKHKKTKFEIIDLDVNEEITDSAKTKNKIIKYDASKYIWCDGKLTLASDLGIVNDGKVIVNKPKKSVTPEEIANRAIKKESLSENYNLKISTNGMNLINKKGKIKAHVDFNRKDTNNKMKVNTRYSTDQEFILNNPKDFITRMVKYHMKDFYSDYPELGNEKQISKKLIKNMPLAPYLALRKIDESLENLDSQKRLEYTLMFLTPKRKKQPNESSTEYEMNLIEEKMKKLKELGINNIVYSLDKSKDNNYRGKVIDDALKARLNLYATIEGVNFVPKNTPVVEKIRAIQAEQAKQEKITEKAYRYATTNLQSKLKQDVSKILSEEKTQNNKATETKPTETNNTSSILEGITPEEYEMLLGNSLTPETSQENSTTTSNVSNITITEPNITPIENIEEKTSTTSHNSNNDVTLEETSMLLNYKSSKDKQKAKRAVLKAKNEQQAENIKQLKAQSKNGVSREPKKIRKALASAAIVTIATVGRTFSSIQTF